MQTESVIQPISAESEGRIGFLGTFASPTLENAFRHQHFRDDRWLICFIVATAALRVLLLLATDYQYFGTNFAFWPLLATRLLVVGLSVRVLFALKQATSPTTVDRLFFAWCLLIAALTIYSLSSRASTETGLLFMSFGVVLVTYCVTPLSLARQAVLAVAYSASVLFVSRHVDGSNLATVGLVHTLSNAFGAVTSWRLNHRRREVFLANRREADLRAHLESAAAEIRTLRGLLSICAWCKRIRDEAQEWQLLENYVQSRTHASFTHGICPDCLDSQVKAIAQSSR